MNRLLIRVAATICGAAAIAWAQEAPAKRDGIIGVWRLVSADHSGEPVQLAGRPQIKMISEKRFMWIEYDPAKNKAVSSGLGTYELNNNSYTEHVEMLDANGQGDAYVGKDLKFTVRIEGDTLTQTGSIGEIKLREIWKRME